jgi:hypothetical protein
MSTLPVHLQHRYIRTLPALKLYNLKYLWFKLFFLKYARVFDLSIVRTDVMFEYTVCSVVDMK